MDFVLYELLLSVLNMSIIASYVIVFVLIIRLFLKKAPKIFSYALWAVVLIRLLLPFSFESDIGLLPSNTEPIPQNIVHTEYPEVDLPFPAISEVINESLPQGEEQLVADPLETPVVIGTLVWSLGVFIMVILSIISYLKLRKRLVGVALLEKNIYISDHIDSPFVMGFMKPKIYLPSNLSGNERTFVISHEQTHIKRFDHITRIIAFIALCIHWFNPLVWIAFILAGKDMETSCDEAVIKKMDINNRADYSETLLKFATNKKFALATPLAFGEGDTKGRVKNVMKYKKPMVWVSVVCLVVVLIVAIGFMTNQKTQPNTDSPLTDIYEEIYANDTLDRPIQTFANMQIGNEWYIGILAGDDIVLSTASNIDGEWKYQGNIIYENAHDGNTVVFSGKENSNGRYDIFLSTNSNLASITRIFEDGEIITVDVDHETHAYIEGDGKENFSPSMTAMEMHNDSKHLDLLYKDANGVVLEEISTQNLTSENEPLLWDLPPMVMVNDKLYLDTGKESQTTHRDDYFDGEITSEVDGNERPGENNQSNFGTGFHYQIIDDSTIELEIEGSWYVYQSEEKAPLGLFHDLSENGEIELTLNELLSVSLKTNSEKISVTFNGDEEMHITVMIYNAKNQNSPIAQYDLKGGETNMHTNLTASTNYIIRTTSTNNDATLIISD